MWAILSGIEGNLKAYEAVLDDIKRQRVRVEELYILGDLVGINPDCDKLVERLQKPRQGELFPQVCTGWWEEQCFILHAIGATSEPTELIEQYDQNTVKLLWDSVSRKSVEWLRSLNFGFHELDCLLIHGSTAGAADKLTPETPAFVMLDRLIRADVNNLFCGRSGLTFQYQLQGGSINNTVQTLDSQNSPQTVTVTARQVIGVGNVGRKPGVATYTLYNPECDRVQFKTVHYGAKKGFQLSAL